VRRLAERLQVAGVRVWFDDWVVKAGDIIALKVDEGLEHSRVLVLCISPAALASGWVALERSTAVHRDPSNAGRRFIPILLADCDLPDTLAKYKYLDFREESEAAFAELLTSCKPETDFLLTSSLPEVQKRIVAKKPKPETSPKGSEPMAVLERKLEGHTGWVRSVVVSPNGQWAASGSHDNTVRIWDLQNGECRTTLKGHNGDVRFVEITPDGQRIISASIHKTIRIWDANLGKELSKLFGYTQVRSVVAFPDNERALSGGGLKLTIWDLALCSCIKSIKCVEQVWSTAVNRLGNQALSGLQDGRILLWDIESGDCLVPRMVS